MPQLVLDLGDVDAIPVLPLWDRRRVAASLANRSGEGTATQSAGPQDRMAKCCNLVRREANASPTMYRTDRGSWSWSLVVRCNEWSCPACGPRRARDTAAQLACIIDSWLGDTAGGLLTPDAWMLTLTIPHRLPDGPRSTWQPDERGDRDTIAAGLELAARLAAGEDVPRRVRRTRTPDDHVASTVDTLYEAHARLLRTPAWRAFCRRFGISSTVRVLDAVFGGANGAHPHFHIALLPAAATVTADERREAWRFAPLVECRQTATADEQQRERDRVGAINAEIERRRAAPSWTAADLTTLDQLERGIVLRYLERDVREAWRDVVEEWTGHRPPSTACARLTPGDDAARYFTAWGLANEVGATPIKARSHLRLLDAVAAGHADAGAEFIAWREATAGRSWVTGLGRARRRLGLDADAVAAHAADQQRIRDNHRAELVAAGLAEPQRIVRPLSLVVPAYLWTAAALVGFDVLERLADYADAHGLPPQDTIIDACLGGLRALRSRGRPPPG